MQKEKSQKNSKNNYENGGKVIKKAQSAYTTSCRTSGLCVKSESEVSDFQLSTFRFQFIFECQHLVKWKTNCLSNLLWSAKIHPKQVLRVSN
ncbi:hypothetical protein DYE50_02670 [Treponema ruminis]|nr:hypothetical protein DYE50_02670 [Treponema ruminis]